jgi:hypothetical protein
MLASILPAVLGVIDKIIPDPEAKAKAKLDLLGLEQSGELSKISAAAGVVTAEVQGDSWLQRSWRPLMMLWFGGLVGAYWFGFTPENLSEERIGDLFTLVQIGIGG